VGLERKIALPTEHGDSHFDAEHFGKAERHSRERLALRIFGFNCPPGIVRHISGCAVGKEQT
jgi:hypothetical protein